MREIDYVPVCLSVYLFGDDNGEQQDVYFVGKLMINWNIFCTNLMEKLPGKLELLFFEGEGGAIKI